MTTLRMVTLCLLLLPIGVPADAPTIDPAEDEQYFGDPRRMLFWNAHEKVSGFRNWDRIYPSRTVRASASPRILPRQLQPLGDVTASLGDVSMRVDEYFQRQNVAGLLVIKDGTIVYERYGLGNDEDTRWVSFSVTKSVVSMLVGAALRDGYIQSVDEPITDYLPRLKGSHYDDSTIRTVLQMASGIDWNEDYADPRSDVNQATWQTLALYDYLAALDRAAPAGTEFNYNTAETNLVGTLLRSAVGNNLSTYLEEKIWHPFGMEADAMWGLTDPGGGEWGGCCLNATLRDYGRIGLFALGGGRLEDGTEVLADGWMTDSATPSDAWDGYGYLWWLGEGEAYRGTGIFGQGICVHPEENVVVALQSARDEASNQQDWAWQTALCSALAAAANPPAD